MSTYQDSELIVNPDGSIYHLKLLPEDIADTIFTVGDPDRVAEVSKRFDRIDVRKQKREFCTHTGELGGRRVSVISTGIGPDNIDIVINELDALVNIDLQAKKDKDEKTSLSFIRLGTSGTLQENIACGDMVFSAYALGMDNLLNFYPPIADTELSDLSAQLAAFLLENNLNLPIKSYPTKADRDLLKSLGADDALGITLTAPGFYAPQGRSLRAGSLIDPSLITTLGKFQYQNYPITNFEMETAAIYGLGQLLGHRCLSCSVILANRATGEFSSTPKQDVGQMIDLVLERWLASK